MTFCREEMLSLYCTVRPVAVAERELWIVEFWEKGCMCVWCCCVCDSSLTGDMVFERDREGFFLPRLLSRRGRVGEG